MIENQLSADNRTVEIEGFRGVLTSEAQLDRLTIADQEGVWLILEGARFNWNRAALFQGALEVRALTAERLEIKRQPLSEPSLPNAQASGFRIPDLPVSVQIDEFGVDEIVAGPGLLGTPFVARLAAKASLVSGQVDLSLEAERLDGSTGEIALDLAFSQADETLRLAARIAEPQGGILARSLSIPDAPSVRFEMNGDGPLDAFAADIRLATDGTERLSGRITLDAAAARDARHFQADLSGDIRPMLAVESRDFFGPRTALRLAGQAQSDGGVTLDELAFETSDLSVTGSGALDEARAPVRLSLQVAIGRAARRVLLPGTDVSLTSADLTLEFDAETGPDWTLAGDVANLQTSDLSVARAALTGRGQIRPGDALPFEGTLSLVARNVAAPDDPDLNAVIGPSLTLQGRISADDDGAIKIDALTLETPHLNVRGEIGLTPGDGRMEIAALLFSDLPDLTPFSGLAGLPLAGGLTANVTTKADLPGGAVELALEGRSEGLDIGQPRLAPLLSPQTALQLKVRRDETGTVIEDLTLENTELDLSLIGTVDDNDGSLILRANLRDAGLLESRAAGALQFEAGLRDLQKTAQIDATLSAEAGLSLNLSGTLQGDAPSLAFNGSLASVERFAAPLTGEALLRGVLDLADVPELDSELRTNPGVTLRIAGPLGGDLARLDFAADVADLGAFVAPLPGPAALDGTLDLSQSEPRVTADLQAEPGISARLDGAVSGEDAQLSLTARLEELASFVPQLPGPATLTAIVKDPAGDPSIEADLSAARGVVAAIRGRPLGADGAITVAATFENLAILVPQLPGRATLAVEIDDPTGKMEVDATLTAGQGLSARLTGRPLSQDAPLNMNAELRDLGVFVPQMPGTAQVNAVLRDLMGRQAVDATVLASGLSARIEGALSDTVDVRARLERLDRFASGLNGGADLSGRASDLTGTPSIEARLRTDSGAAAEVSGTLGLSENTARLSGTGTLPLALAQPFAGNRALSGTAQFDLNLNGPLAPAALTGTVDISDARLFDPGVGLTVDGLGGTIRLGGSRARIDLAGRANDAPLTVTGGLGLAAPFASDLGLTLTRLPYRLADILETQVSANLRLTGNLNQRLAIGGRVQLFETEVRVPDTGLGGATDIPLITHQDPNPAVRQTQARAGLSQSAQGQTGSANGPVIPLDVEVVAVDPIFVRGRGLDAAFEGALRLTGTAQSPEPIGAFRLQRGRLDFLGRRLTLTEGNIRLSGTAVPSLEVVSETVLDDLTATVAVRGPANAPELEISSSPERPEDEVLAQILFGRSFSTLSPFQIARLVASVRTLTGAGGPGILERTRQVLRLDDLDIRTDESTGATELSFGQRITDDVYSEVEVDSEGNAQINLNLDVGQNTRLRGSVSNTGEAGIGIFWQKDY